MVSETFQLGGKMKRYIVALLVASLLSPALLVAQTSPDTSQTAKASSGFDVVADQALAAMKAKAQTMGIGGVAVVAYFEGDTIQAWSSKMIVIGRYKDLPTATDKGSNLLGIAYAKASEMADTLKDSGSGIRPPMTGEFGWNGGVIARGKTGYVIAAFSGGKSDDDVQISREGLSKLKAKL
jgi:hypothetical protein